jgi:hypothetical protein
MFKYKTEAELTAMTPEQRDIYGEQKREFEAKATLKMITDAIKERFPEKTAEEIKTEADAIKAKETADKLLADEVKEIKETVNQLKENTGTSTTKETLLSVVEKNFDKIKASKEKGKEATFTVKADTVRASVTNNAMGQIDPVIGSLAHRKLTIYDIFRKIPIGKDMNGVYRYADWDKDTTVRAAAAVAEGANFPSSTAKWQMYSINLEKIGDSVPMSEELVYDSAMFAAELDNFLRVNVAIKRDDDLTTSNGTSPNIFGILTILSAYVPAAAGIVDASIYDLIVKVREAITKPFGSKFSPNVALMNITDINRMKLKKDANNNYILPPFFNKDGQIVDTCTVIECNSLTANSMILGDSRWGAIIEEGDITVTTGFATGDFESDMQTLKARQRLNLLIKNSEKLGWLKVTDIDAALTTLAS